MDKRYEMIEYQKKLMALLMKYECFGDPKHRNYLKLQLCHRAYGEVAKQLNSTHLSVKKTYQYLRSLYEGIKNNSEYKDSDVYKTFQFLSHQEINITKPQNNNNIKPNKKIKVEKKTEDDIQKYFDIVIDDADLTGLDVNITKPDEDADITGKFINKPGEGTVDAVCNDEKQRRENEQPKYSLNKDDDIIGTFITKPDEGAVDAVSNGKKERRENEKPKYSLKKDNMKAIQGQKIRKNRKTDDEGHLMRALVNYINKLSDTNRFACIVDCLNNVKNYQKLEEQENNQ